jgi:hypothetical protein
MFGWVQIHETRYRDNGDNTYTTITSATHYGHDGRVIKETEEEQSTMQVSTSGKPVSKYSMFRQNKAD